MPDMLRAYITGPMLTDLGGSLLNIFLKLEVDVRFYSGQASGVNEGN